MVDPVTAADMEASPKEGAPQRTPEQIAQEWLGRIQAAEKARKAYWTRGRQIIKRFKNKRTLTTLGVPIANRRMNVLWSNTQTQKPVLYSLEPKANVSRRNKTKDPIGRTASIVLQNCLQNSVAMEDFSYVMNQIVLDRLLPGSGIAMVEYVPEVKGDQLGWQAAETRYIHWEDWLTNPARVWQENEFFAYRVYLSRRECYEIALASSGGDEAFAEDVWREITLTHRPTTGEQKENRRPSDTTGPAKAEVWVIWDLTEKQVIQLAVGYPKAPLAIMEPPVSFDGFWPVPRPLQATTSNDSTIPVPDFDQYVDQADEIDLMTQRIGILSKALRLRGLYPADMDSLKALVEGGDMDMIPYDQWQLIQERGGPEKLVLWFPVEAIAATLIQCIQAREQAIEIMYQVTGIADIMRGATEPSETATAQQLKAQFGGVRVRESQKDVQRFIRDLFRLKAEVICEHFSLDVIKAMAGVRLLSEQEKQLVRQAAMIWQQFGQAQQMAQQAAQAGQPVGMPQQPTIPQPSEEMIEALGEPSWDQIMSLLRNEKLRGFIVDVETDSTIEPDQQAQQQSAAEFTAAVAQFLTAALPVMQAAPESVEFLGELMAWTTRQWKGADTIEGAVDEFVEMMKKKVQAAQQSPPPPSPEMLKAQADVEMTRTDQQTQQFKGAVEMKKAEMDLAQTQLEHEGTMREKAADLEIAKATPKPASNGAPA